MRASQQLRYAIYGVFDLAFHASGRCVALQEVGARQEIPTRYLEQIFQKLRRAGIVAAKRGPGGGYRLARPPEGISLADLVTAVQGRTLCLAEAGTHCARSPEFVWERVEAALGESLARHSIADLCREAAARGMERAGGEPAMYEI
jgi:Rrf2 family iron-sulfur cluster assembly transcriptional regulator